MIQGGSGTVLYWELCGLLAQGYAWEAESRPQEGRGGRGEDKGRGDGRRGR